MKIICIIPARYESTRFEGKALADICGRPMIQHVYERVLKSSAVSYAAVATDDERIFTVVKEFGGNVIMTSSEHKSGTDRIAEAVSTLNDVKNSDVIVNIQGDQPLFEPSQIDEVAEPLLKDPTIDMCTLMYLIKREEEITHPNAVKVVFDRDGFAIYFSRSTIPYVRVSDSAIPYYKHHGIYAYRKTFLMTFTRLEEGYLERLEALEQLRAIEHGYRIKVVETPYDSVEVDIPEELERVERIIKNENY
ncbi:MAG: 3-deoxy-manno-octulosonate cytidylyltransferase [Thermodesulfobacteriota bacterium]|nr:3-deoxy-manno-octulosonate cytidylyltransferase [Thermodesulfobacteriota bacterium]